MLEDDDAYYNWQPGQGKDHAMSSRVWWLATAMSVIVMVLSLASIPLLGTSLCGNSPFLGLLLLGAPTLISGTAGTVATAMERRSEGSAGKVTRTARQASSRRVLPPEQLDHLAMR